DWRQIAALYSELLRFDPSPVIEANRAIAVAYAEGPAAGLAILDTLAARSRLAPRPHRPPPPPRLPPRASPPPARARPGALAQWGPPRGCRRPIPLRSRARASRRGPPAHHRPDSR